MKYFKCDVCGAQFDEEFWEGGYIDHTNLTNNRHLFTEDNEEELLDEIMKKDDSEDLREKDDILCRLGCVMHWEHLSEDFKNKIKEQVDKIIEEESL